MASTEAIGSVAIWPPEWGLSPGPNRSATVAQARGAGVGLLEVAGSCPIGVRQVAKHCMYERGEVFHRITNKKR